MKRILLTSGLLFAFHTGLIFHFLGGGENCYAQQLPHYTQYLLNDYVLNPAVAGSQPFFEAKSNNRYQWVGITDAPRTYILSMHGPIQKQNMGLGGYLFTDITGPTRRTGLNFSYAYHLRLNQEIKLSMGLSAGILQFMVDGAKITTGESGDPALSNGVQSVLMPDAGAGIYLYSKKFFLSLSAPQLFQSKIQFFENYPETLSRLVRHYFASLGYRLDLGDDFVIEPSAMIKQVNPVPVQYQPTLRIIYQDKIWLAGSFRTSFLTHDAIGLMLGYTFQNNLSFGYSYDLIQSNIRSHSSGSHEVMIGIRFRGSKPVKTQVSIE